MQNSIQFDEKIHVKLKLQFWHEFYFVYISFILTNIFSVQVETTKTQNPLEYNSTFAEESLTFTNPLEDIEDYEEDEEVVPSPVLDPDLEAKVILLAKWFETKNSSKHNIY